MSNRHPVGPAVADDLEIYCKKKGPSYVGKHNPPEPIPFLHSSDTEVFRAPPNALTVLLIMGILLSDVVFVGVRLRNRQHGRPGFRIPE